MPTTDAIMLKTCVKKKRNITYRLFARNVLISAAEKECKTKIQPYYVMLINIIPKNTTLTG